MVTRRDAHSGLGGSEPCLGAQLVGGRTVAARVRKLGEADECGRGRAADQRDEERFARVVSPRLSGPGNHTALEGRGGLGVADRRADLREPRRHVCDQP